MVALIFVGCADLMMATVLRIPRHTDLVTSNATLSPYLARCEARPAFQKTLAQLASFKEPDTRPGSVNNDNDPTNPA